MKKLIYSVLTIAIFTLASKPSFGYVAEYKEIVDKKCYTNGIHTGWENDCSSGFGSCVDTTCA